MYVEGLVQGTCSIKIWLSRGMLGLTWTSSHQLIVPISPQLWHSPTSCLVDLTIPSRCIYITKPTNSSHWGFFYPESVYQHLTGFWYSNYCSLLSTRIVGWLLHPSSLTFSLIPFLKVPPAFLLLWEEEVMHGRGEAAASGLGKFVQTHLGDQHAQMCDLNWSQPVHQCLASPAGTPWNHPAQKSPMISAIIDIRKWRAASKVHFACTLEQLRPAAGDKTPRKRGGTKIRRGDPIKDSKLQVLTPS